MTAITIPENQMICTEFDGGEGILVDLQTRRYYQLNETALLVWKSLENGAGIDEIVSKLTNDYDIGSAHALASVEGLVARLKAYRLVNVG